MRGMRSVPGAGAPKPPGYFDLRKTRGAARGLRALPRRALIWLIRFYRACISPLYPACCRYRPTCSQYALEAVRKYGALKGGILALRRILRCNPFHAGGYDPVP